MINLIVCFGKNQEMGAKGDIPWKNGLPSDWQYVKKTTSNHVLVMGTKTFYSLGNPLPNRKHIVLTKNVENTKNKINDEEVLIYSSIEEVLAYYENVIKPSGKELFVFGGGEIYRLFMPYVERMYITKINQTFKADTFFPTYDEKDWNEIFYQKGMTNDKNPYDYAFYVYERK